MGELTVDKQQQQGIAEELFLLHVQNCEAEKRVDSQHPSSLVPSRHKGKAVSRRICLSTSKESDHRKQPGLEGGITGKPQRSWPQQAGRGLRGGGEAQCRTPRAGKEGLTLLTETPQDQENIPVPAVSSRGTRDCCQPRADSERELLIPRCLTWGAVGRSVSPDIPGTWVPSQWRSAREFRRSWSRTDEEVRSPGTRRWSSLQGSHGGNRIPAEKPSLSSLLVCTGRVELREQAASPLRDTGECSFGFVRLRDHLRQEASPSCPLLAAFGKGPAGSTSNSAYRCAYSILVASGSLWRSMALVPGPNGPTPACTGGERFLGRRL
ncbi:uncharacterized protein LOC131578721 [Poecile atricapillus]|uniref:uncharacterized protein LOC131578721 n=1 Tax=Poecile atricapillus TaxID=48891 RepID=UPI002738A975|nr:uncharacterized protein LOC131578721 [Poecile atricapillus]